MVHAFFEKIASRPDLADRCATNVIRNRKASQLFTQVFSVFFPEDGELDYNVKSWLDAIANQFQFDNNYENKFTIWAVKKLFLRLKLHPKDLDTVNVFNFWLYLISIYKLLMEEEYDRDDNIFRFMEGCSIYQVKVVLMGNNPSKEEPSSGYAFQDSVCPSTKQILDFADSEIDGICSFLDNYKVLSLSKSEITEAKENCELWGWIEQGVLLLHPKLTFEGNEDISEAWEIFTDFILKYLSDVVGKRVFIFLGLAVADKATLINQDRHMVMKLYHPSQYSLNPEHSLTEKLDWDAMLPFTNANFYLWQTSGGDLETMIDWTSVGWVKKKRIKRISQWNEFFCDVRKKCGLISRGSQVKFGGDLIVKRGMNGLLSLMVPSES